MTEPERLSPAEPNAAQRRTPVWLWLVAVLALGVVALLQTPAAEPPPTPEHLKALATGADVPSPEGSPFVLFGKIAVFLHRLGSSGSANAEFATLLDQVTTPTRGFLLGPPPVPSDQPEGVAAERLRAAIVIGEAMGGAEAVKRLETLKPDLASDSALNEDVESLISMYSSGTPLSPDQSKVLVERHGWFGRLAEAYGAAPGNAFIDQAAHEATVFLVVAMVVLGAFLLGFLVGLAVLLITIILAGSGQLRMAMVPPRIGGRVWVETFIVFAGGFAALHVLGSIAMHAAGPDAAWPVWLRLGGQVSLALLLLWPLARGVSWSQFSGEIGWHRGRGVFREVGAGILAYAAALPIYFGMAVIVALAMMLRSIFSDGPAPQPPANKVVEMLGQGGPWMIVCILGLAVIWAPIVEEGIFRGCLYRNMRAKMPAAGAALLTAAMFAAMHSYVFAGLLMVGTLGFVFGMMREWRSSLIASMTAHFLHNSLVMALMLAALYAMRG
ncbi:MAG: CPBP family intramembrane metalloprotease [Phycisphaeraceae bacterium]|nr:CPBP family intramembrane metalloprotease [Phycisphaeraceae bacterium]